MKQKFIWARLFFLICILFFSALDITPVNAQVTPTSLEVISPQNVKDLRLLTKMGQGVYNGAFDFQPGGNLIAAAAATGIALLDRTSGKQTAIIPIGFSPTALSIAPDGKTLAAVYNVPTGKAIDPSMINGPEYQPRIGIFSLPDGQPKGEVIKDLQECGQSNIWQIAFTPDGNSLVFDKKYGDREAQKLFCVLSIATGKITNTLNIPVSAESSLSADGKYVAMIQINKDYQADKVSVYDTQSFKQVIDISFPLTRWPELSFTRLGVLVMRYYDGEDEKTPHNVRLWSLPDGKPLLTLQEKEQYMIPALPGTPQTKPYDRIMSEDLSPDGQWVVTGSQNGKVKLWNAKTGQMEKELGVLSWTSHNMVENPGGGQASITNSYVNPVAFSSDGKMLAAAENLTVLGQSGQIHIYSVPDGKETTVFKGEGVGSESTGLAFSPDSSRIAYGGFPDGHAEVHNVADGGLLLTLAGHTGLVNQVQFSPNGKWLASASDDHTIRLWDASSGQVVRVLNGHSQRVNQIAFSPDSLWLVSGADDNTIRRWKVEDGSLLETRPLEDGNWQVNLLSVLADQHSVVYTALKYPSPLIGYVTKQILWDTESGKETMVGGGKVTILAMGMDGQTFVGYDGKGKTVGTLKADGKMTLNATAIRSPFGNGNLTGSTLTPDNRLLFSGNGFGLQSWELMSSTAKFLGVSAGDQPVSAYGDLYQISPDGKILALASSGVIYLLGVPVP